MIGLPTALILGIDGQDGSYLAEMLLEKGYRVIGWTPENITVSLANIAHLLERITLISGDLRDFDGLQACLAEHQPDEVYHLASPSSPYKSWQATVEVGDIAALGTARLLEALRRVAPKARFYQASSSELFGDPQEVPQNENTPFRPLNPYGISKLYAHWITVRYRQHYGLFAVSGILYNHESPRRGLEFVTRKITHTAAQIKLGMAKELRLGNLEARRDWGYAGDYIVAMWKMLQQPVAEDYVVGTGVTHSVRQFCEQAFSTLGLDYRDFVIQDEQFFRQEDTAQLVADARKAREKLGWHPTVSFEALVRMMVMHDLRLLESSSSH